MSSQIYGIDSIYWILIFASAFIGFIILFFLIYRIIYKIRINKALKSERRISSPLISPGGVAVAIGIVMWIAVSFFMIVQLHIIDFALREYGNYSGQSFHAVIEQNGLTNSEKISSDYRFNTGEHHSEDKTYDLNVSISSNIVLGKNDKLTFRIGDSKTELKLSKGGRYTGTVRVSAWNGCPSGILTFEGDGIKISQILSAGYSKDDENDENEKDDEIDLNGDEMWQDFYPTAEFVVLNKKYSKENNIDTIESDIYVYPYPAENDKKLVFTEMKLVFDTDGTVFREVDLLKDKSVSVYGEGYSYHLKDNVKSGNVNYGFAAKDSEGNSYIYYYHRDFVPSGNRDSLAEAENEEEKPISAYERKYNTITDKNGKLLKRYVSIE